MSKRITLTDEDIKIIGVGLKMIENNAPELNTYEPTRVATKQRLDQIKSKLGDSNDE